MTLRMNATLADNGNHLGDDKMLITSPSWQPPGYGGFIPDQFMPEGGLFNLTPNGTLSTNLTFSRGYQPFSKVTYYVSETPLNITIDPSTFLSQRIAGPYQSVVQIHAEPDL